MSVRFLRPVSTLLIFISTVYDDSSLLQPVDHVLDSPTIIPQKRKRAPPAPRKKKIVPNVEVAPLSTE